MSAPAENRTSVLRFLDAFFQERNIKWMLGIGMLILLGSSLMLVTTHWNEYTPVWKYLILLGYTAGLHGLGQFSYHSLALRKTGTGLMALTVLLIPLTFLGLHWVHPDPLATWGSLAGQLGLVALLGGNAVFSLLAARRVFDHFLRRSQPTFLVSYFLLALAGAVVPSLPAHLAPVTALVLWGLFAIGTIKVNRHVFWLTEEHRLPRICGYFPILLLSGMFLTLFALSVAAHLPVSWIGFGLVLSAIPVLLSADALADVFQQRSTSLPRPLPWSILLPIFIGLTMTVAGVWISGVGFPNTHSLPPTAVLAAVVMLVTARRTQQSVFVWLMLGAVLVAYQTSPVFFQQIARTIVRQGAVAVHEQRLPYAFYGLTYLPLLAGFSLVSARLARRGEQLFCVPLRQLAVGAGLVMLVVAVTHAKAMFPVGLALCGLFGMQSALFRDRRHILAGISAFLLAAFGMTAFLSEVLFVPPGVELPLLAWAAAGGLLLWPGGMIDRKTAGWRPSSQSWPIAPDCRLASLVALLVTAAVWIVHATSSGAVAAVAGTLSAALLLVHAWQFRHRQIARIAIGFVVLLAGMLAAEAGWSLSAVMMLVSVILCGLWGVGRKTQTVGIAAAAGESSSARAQVESVRTLRLASADVALVGLVGVTILYILPAVVATIRVGADFSAWVAAAVCLIWSADAAWRRRSGMLTVLGWLLGLGTIGVVAATALGWELVYDWYPALATVLPLIVLSVIPRIERTTVGTTDAVSVCRVWAVLRVCTLVTLAIVAIGSMAVFTAPLQIAGVAALAGLLWSAVRWKHTGLRTAALSVATWQGLAGILQLTLPGVHAIENVPLPVPASTALPVALGAVLLSLAWNGALLTRITIAGCRHAQIVLFRTVTAAGLLSTILFPGDGLSLWEAVVAAAVFALLAAEQLWRARQVYEARPEDDRSQVRRRDEGEQHVWLALGITAAGAGYLLLTGFLTLGSTVSLFAPLVVGVAFWGLAQLLRESPAWSVVSRPLLTSGLSLPLVSVLVGIVRGVSMADPHWLGINSLALLLAAGFYFWRGLEKRTPGLLIGSAAILNVALALFWREVAYSDPQFFMIPLGLSVLGLVELLKPQIETRYVNPLRYIGALTILVSPTFQIVEGSWLHLLTLMIASVLITLAAIGLRVRALMYTGTAFLVADIVAMVVRGSIDNTSLLWIAGILVGTAVIGLAACCERHREQMLQQLRLLAAELETWD